jgi:hypothetical protein
MTDRAMEVLWAKDMAEHMADCLLEKFARLAAGVLQTDDTGVRLGVGRSFGRISDGGGKIGVGSKTAGGCIDIGEGGEQLNGLLTICPDDCLWVMRRQA